MRLRDIGLDVFDDWYSVGEEADDKWMEYEKARGRDYHEALKGHTARHVFEYDLSHLQRSDACVMVAPAGKSGHLELGYMLGQGKPGFIYMPDEPERWDMMYLFATKIVRHPGDLLDELESLKGVLDKKDEIVDPGGRALAPRGTPEAHSWSYLTDTMKYDISHAVPQPLRAPAHWTYHYKGILEPSDVSDASDTLKKGTHEPSDGSK